MAYLVSYLACALVMGMLDFLWLSNMLEAFYRPVLGPMLAEKPNMAAAFSFYILYLTGILIFAVVPALSSGNWWTASCYGALFGLFAFATYDLTNLATLKIWSVKISLIDIAWGTVLTSVTASAGAYAGLRMP